MIYSLSHFDLMSVYFTFRCFMICSKKIYPDIYYDQLESFIDLYFENKDSVTSSRFLQDIKCRYIHSNPDFYKFILMFFNHLTKYIA